jgi:nucleoid DNA-binding protein
VSTKRDLEDALVKLGMARVSAFSIMKVVEKANLVVLASKGAVHIPGIGKVKLAVLPARAGRNPRTGESLEIPSSVRARFKPSAKLKRSLKPA